MSDFRFVSIVLIFRGCLSLTPLVVLFREGVGPGLFKHKVIILLQNPNSADRLVSLISDIVKFISAYLSQAVIIRFTVRLAQISCNSDSDFNIHKCVVMYSHVPPEALVPFISCACRVVNLSNVSCDAC